MQGNYCETIRKYIEEYLRDGSHAASSDSHLHSKGRGQTNRSIGSQQRVCNADTSLEALWPLNALEESVTHHVTELASSPRF